MNRPDDAVAKLQQAAALEPTAHVYSQIGMVYAKQRRWDEALEALATAEKIDPSFAPTLTSTAATSIFSRINWPRPWRITSRALALDPDSWRMRAAKLVQGRARMRSSA